jgi:hypothetical protein
MMTASFTKNDKDQARPTLYASFVKVIYMCVTYLLNKTEFVFFYFINMNLGVTHRVRLQTVIFDVTF